jgi:hypothetical protein
MVGRIVKCDKTGDSVVAEFDTAAPETVKVANDELTKFLKDCILKYGQEPPVWAKRVGEPDFSPFEHKKESVGLAEEVLIHPPLVAG